jgi:D-ribulokinase
MASMSAIGLRSGPAAPGMTEFHRAKRKVHESMRKAEYESRDAMRGV